jgi:hypothetical protein
MRRAIAVGLITVTAVVACKKDQTYGADTTAKAAAGPSAAATAARASVMITSPAKGATTGTDVTVTLRATGVTIAKADGGKVENVGHYHLFLDTIPTADNVPIPPTSVKIVHIGTGDSTFTFKGVAPGPHQIIAVLGYGNHTPMPAGRDTVTFTVKK